MAKYLSASLYEGTSFQYPLVLNSSTTIWQAVDATAKELKRKAPEFGSTSLHSVRHYENGKVKEQIMDTDSKMQSSYLLQLEVADVDILQRRHEEEEFRRLSLRPHVISFASAVSARLVSGVAQSGHVKAAEGMRSFLNNPDNVEKVTSFLQEAKLNSKASDFAITLDKNFNAWNATLKRSKNFTVFGADWYPILDMAFVESKVHLELGVFFIFGKVELRNLRTRSGFEIDVFDRSPNSTVRYEQAVYFCFSCLPPASIIAGLFKYPSASLPNTVINITWQRTQPPLQRTYGPGNAALFLSASTVLPGTSVPWSTTSGGGYELQAVETVFICQDPVDLASCESVARIEHCLSSKVEALAKQDDTWARLATGATEREIGVRAQSGEAPASWGDDLSIVRPRDTAEGGRVGAAVGAALGGTAVLVAVCAVVMWLRYRLRRRCDGAAAAVADLVNMSGSVTPSPADDPMAVKIVISEEEMKATASSHRGDHTTETIASDGSGRHQDATAVAASTAAASARSQSPHPCTAPCGRAETGGGAAYAHRGSPGTLLELTAGLAGAFMTISTLGESFQPFSSSERASLAPRIAPTMLMMAQPNTEQRGQPVVMVAGITIELMNVIGTGSFGKVFRGSWQGRSAAVKVLQYGAELCRAVHNEVLLSQTLRHPNVVAALYYAQVLPGGRLGLQTTSDGAVCSAAGAPTSSENGHGVPQQSEGRVARVEVAAHVRAPHEVAVCGPAALYSVNREGQGGSADGGGVREGVDARSEGRCIVRGITCDPRALGETTPPAAGIAVGSKPGSEESSLAHVRRSSSGDGSGGGGCAGGKQGLPAPLSSQGAGTMSIVATAAATAAAAAEGVEGASLPQVVARTVLLGHDKRQSVSTTQLQLLHRDEGMVSHRGGSSSAPLTSMRPSELCEREATELAGSASYGTNGSSHTPEDETGAAGGCCSQPDVLSRWDEQRRRHEHVELMGAKLIGPEMVVSSNGFILQAVGASTSDNCKDKDGASVACDGKQVANGRIGGCGDGKRTIATRDGTGWIATAWSGGTPLPPAQQQQRPNLLSPSTPAAAAAAALPLEALWLATHTQPAEGISHGFLVMELCEGGSAFAWRSTHWCGPNERPDLSVLLRLALDIAYGMSHIHSLGICHGDLKLSNVLLARSSDAAGACPNDLLAGWVAKVCDFGLSRVLTGDRTHVSTRPYGTPTHMAPELWTKGHMSQPADVYAFGITLWELATGERPYKGLNAARILHRVLLNGGRPVLPLWLPPSYTRLATSCWAQCPKNRPTFGEIVRHLEAMLAVLSAVTPR